MADSLPELYTARDIARAAGVAESDVRSLLDSGAIHSVASFLRQHGEPAWNGFVLHGEAVRAVRTLRQRKLLDAKSAEHLGLLLTPSGAQHRQATVPFIVSTSLHVLVAVLLFIGSLGLTAPMRRPSPSTTTRQPVRLVFLAQPGPGGGGGGGGLKMKPPPPKAQRKGPQQISSPIPARRLPPPIRARTETGRAAAGAARGEDAAAGDGAGRADRGGQEGPGRPAEGSAEGAAAEPGRRRQAAVPAPARARALAKAAAPESVRARAAAPAAARIARAAASSPPRLIKEVRADYTDAARRQNISGEVVLEIVVRSDGSVGDVRVLRRLGSGLDERAVQAVRQWRFSPARLKGAPVDVIVEVSVEFKLR